MKPTLAIFATVGVVAVLGGTWYATQRDADRFAECRASAVAGGAGAIGGPFELVNAKGETVTDTDVITEPSLLYFGFTFCPDVCPLDTSRNAEAVDLLTDVVTARHLFLSRSTQSGTRPRWWATTRTTCMKR